MTIRTISRPLPGERVVGLAPGSATQAAAAWLRRPNLFPGRALSAGALDQRQRWQAGHIAQRGQDWTAGIVEGLQLEFAPADGAGFAEVRVRVGSGRGLCVSGEDVVLAQSLECRLADVPVTAPPGFFVDGSGVGDVTGDGSLLPRAIGTHLGALAPEARATLPTVGVLVLQPVLIDRADFDATDPCERSACDDTAVDDRVAFEDWRIADAVRLLWYVWPGEWRNLPPVPAAQLRNALAWTIFRAEAMLAPGSALPWEEWGLPVALVQLDGAGVPEWIDRASVARRGGAARDARLQRAGRDIAANSRLPALWQAQIEQLAEQIAAAGDPTPPAAELAQAFGHFLPPAGLLPRHVWDPAAHRSDFLPPGFDIDAAPVPVEQLDLALRASASMAPLNLASPESVRLLVPVPLQSWEPRLLLTDAVDAAFQLTLDRFLLDRARALGSRQGQRVREHVLQRALGGDATAPVRFDDDALAVERESLAPWGPPPAGGGHRSSLRAGVHQHYFERASETLTVSGDRLYGWVCLDPQHPPRTLMLQWHAAGSWEHRAYWGENLIAWGVDGSSARTRLGDLPTAGAWLRLEIPAAAVALVDASIDGMAFTLFDGRAAFAMAGVASGSSETKWFCNVLPAGAQRFGDEPWELLTGNDLWSPFEPTLGVLPVTPGTLPPSAGAHHDAPADGMHQHFIEDVAPAFTPAAGEHLFCWVWLDPVDPPRELMLQWRTAARGWEQRAFWGFDLIGWGTPGTRSRRRAGALPQPGRWLRLQVSAASLDLEGTPITGIAFTQFDGFAAFGATGAGMPDAAGTIVTERLWFAGTPPAGARQRGLWNLLAPREMHAPSPAAHTGQVQALAELALNPALQVLSEQERAQIHRLGADGFAGYLESRADRADDLVNYGFVKVQTDIYRVRQLMLGTTAASRLVVSPTLASIAQADTAVASQEQIASFVDRLRTPAALRSAGLAAAAPATSKTTATATRATAATAAARAVAAPERALGIVSLGAGLSSGVLLDAAIRQDGTTRLQTAAPAQQLALASAIRPIRATKAPAPSPRVTDVTAAGPLIGQTFIRTTTLAKRLEDPKSKEARDYATASRYESVLALLRLADALTDEDGGMVPGLFDGIELRGLDGDDFLADLPEVQGRRPLTRPFSHFLADRTLLPRLLRVPQRAPPATPDIDPDEAAMFSDSTDLSDHVVALMRKLEGRIKLYRDAAVACRRTVAVLAADLALLRGGLARVGEELAEARHDVGMARALLAEESSRIAEVNARRSRVLAEEVKFLAYVRPREADSLLATPVHPVDPGLVDPPVPACLREHPDIPDELDDLLRVLREAPAAWFVGTPTLLDDLGRIDQLVRTLQGAQRRALAGIARPEPLSATGVVASTVAISNLVARQVGTLTPRLAAIRTLDIGALATTTWQGIRTQAAQVLSFGDLIEGGHGRADVARRAAAEFDDIRRISACLHAEFSAVAPALRLGWAETLSQFDESPNLRNLASLPRWAEIGIIDRRQMQGCVDWLFAQVEPGQPAAVALVNDLVRMALLLASHAPIDRIVAGRLARPVTGVHPGIRIPLALPDRSRLRIGMQALMFRGDALVARAVVEDAGALEISARVVHTASSRIDLGDDVRVHFDDSAMSSLAASGTRRTLFGR